MMVATYQVGARLDHGRVSPSAIPYTYSQGDHVLRIVTAGLPDDKHHEARYGILELALVPGTYGCSLLYRFEPHPWGRTHFSWWRMPETDRIMPPAIDPHDSVSLTVVLVDQRTMLIEGLPTYILPYSFAHHLHQQLREQHAQRLQQQTFDHERAEREGIGAVPLLQRAIARCVVYPTRP